VEDGYIQILACESNTTTENIISTRSKLPSELVLVPLLMYRC
jgi:hypothetical protein